MSQVASHPGTGKSRASGNLRIGDHWNTITIIALSQSNPLKAAAALVENSIDAGAKTIVITRGKYGCNLTSLGRPAARMPSGAS